MGVELGRHLILEIQGCDPEKLAKAEEIERLLVEAARKSQLTIMGVKTHYFNPGATSMVIIGESHLSIHTWPEYGYAAVDIFVCRGKDPWKACKVIIEALKPEKVRALEIKRGVDTLIVEDVPSFFEKLSELERNEEVKRSIRES
ncbi:MAG: adenosylmethionine decarboxylase [Thermoprotei archaeon]|nr:MAG: adenosylmethionine decarboxylase [Thermoprotei archaeon]